MLYSGGCVVLLPVTNNMVHMQGSHRHPEAKGKDWVQKKKSQMRKKGYTNVPSDSKYTGRKRKDHW